MGMQGPLTAQALRKGRSPYDDVVQGEGEDENHEPRQQYDHRGRPINPESKRINRDMIRSHNEVMLVVGVAEPENPPTAPGEAELKRQHSEYEETTGSRLAWAAKRFIHGIGLFGLTGARERVLVYKRYSDTPFRDLYRMTRMKFSVSQYMFPGAPAGLLAQYFEQRFTPPWQVYDDFTFKTYCMHEAWYYVIDHLQLYASFQRLGLISSTQLLPSWRYFIPFTDDSPMQCPPPLEDLTPQSLLQWVGGVLVSVTPFLLWTITQRLARDWKPIIWRRIIERLPNTMTYGRGIGPLPALSSPTPVAVEVEIEQEPPEQDPSPDENGPAMDSDQIPQSSRRNEPDRRQSVHSAGVVEEFASDDDDHEVVSATLISFDVEATDATDVPQGLWSAELRPSTGPDIRMLSGTPIYLSTMLTKLPALMAANIFNDQLIRLMIAPYEAMALRLSARAFCIGHGLPCDDIFSVHPLRGLNVTWLVNFLGFELLHLMLSGEVWSLFAYLSQSFHKSEDEWKEWKENEGKE
ncbi:unnamed protein product [Clonostachys rosea]|uniref:ER-bound oxygenase mpaB/mpaB'/Rubber oxygenase catalytic domain-containing protein n=1 Tax=Bionectria ochroleuca TaxID=29856 RepID=A0ABY6U105_BIOOC|nr:unnamed protein product [Clonostachys rosea]